MKLLKNDKGIALVTSLMLTLISLTIVMAMLYLVTQGIQTSGQNKKYHTALDAAYGGSEIVLKDIMPVVFQNYSSTGFVANIQGAFSGVNLQVLSTQECLQKKLSYETTAWPAGCSNDPNPAKSPDLSITLPSSTGNPYIVYSKIVDTVKGNTSQSGLQLEGSGVAESSSILTPQHFPFYYRLEIQGEKQTGATARANIEVLYAF